jgi:hypothetical protein
MTSVNGGWQMGGFGIGRRWSCETKGRTGEHPALDVRQLQRGGLLRPGRSFTYRWYLDGKLAASINVTAEQDRVILSYEYGNPDESWQRDQYPVLLEWLQCNYGGGRAWFLCPGDGCGLRVAIIYGKIIFACRHCHSLAYVSQRKPAWRRGLNLAQSIRERLGGTANMYDPFPGKPKGMHWRTYLELRRQHDHANANSWPGWVRRWKMPSRTGLSRIGRQWD